MNHTDIKRIFYGGFMNTLETITNTFVTESRKILRENLVGVYLHGSAVMGCFNREKSDIDLLVVVNDAISDKIKKQYMDMVVLLNKDAPTKGIEMSIVRKAVCKPFVYPTPFELHFSTAHLDWYNADPLGYVAKMNGTDKDLAAHFTVLYHRGKRLYGEEIKDIFEMVNEKFYFDSIWNDVADAEDEILENPTYMILNLCRVLAYRNDRVILSKQEGGAWGIANLPAKYHDLIRSALNDYSSIRPFKCDENHAKDYAVYMIKRLTQRVSPHPGTPDTPQETIL